MSVIAPEGEKCVGSLEEKWMGPESDPWVLIGVLVAVLSVITVIFYINRGKFDR